MRRLLLSLALLVLPVAAHAAAVVWTCTRDFQVILPTGSGGAAGSASYMAVGSCSGTAQAGTAAGDFLGASASVADTAAALCGSSSSVLVRLMTGMANTQGGGVTLMVGTYFDHSTRLLQLVGSNTTANAPLLGNTTAIGASTIFPFIAFCR